MAGNVASAEGAMRAGCRFYAGYPITPQNELIAHMADQLPLRGGVFVQAESELAAINMVFGAAAAGTRAMTSSSSPGISLKQEGISYLAGCELPAVIVNVQRGGPGLGDIRPAQGDYFQATRGGGHGDYHCVVLAPSTVQEMADLTYDAFDLADKWRNPAIVLADGMVGQMMEPVRLDHLRPPQPPDKPWALTGARGRPKNVIRSLYIVDGELEKHNRHLIEKYGEIERTEVRWRTVGPEDAAVVLVAFGACARIVREVVEHPPPALRGRLALVQPITLWPFPYAQLAERARNAAAVVSVEMSAGQLVQDVRLAVEGRCPVHLLACLACSVPRTSEIADYLLERFA
jgi:2-oxoglutarate ferredoxin oxidoreductase subunit alpha